MSLTLAEALGIHIPDWYADALCAQIGGDEWFPEKGGTTHHAKKVCLACPVREQCLEYALDREEDHGIWGATPPRDRRKLKKNRTAA